jgi:hypothetical protein
MAMDGAGLAAARQAAMDAIPYVQSNNPADAVADSEARLLADSTAIVTYIQTNSELVPTTSDTGPAGAGIISGRVG